MLKRFVARLLIITQIYSNLFQGIVHAATLVDESHYHRHLLEKPDDRGDDESIPPTASSSVEDAHISSFTHLYSEVNQRGELQFALGDGSFKAPRVFTIPALESPEDILEYGGVTVKAQSTSFRFQGLQVSVNRAGVMVVEGCQTEQNPIFLASNRPIILSNIEASGLSIAAPRIVHSGISTIAQLKFEGLGTAGDASFINAGQISAKELFLNHLNSVNGGSINAVRFAVDGKLASTGSIASGELILEESAFLKLTETSRADIKTLFLSKASHFENYATTHTSSIGVLDGLGGSVTNHGTLAVGAVAADSAFQAITNRHFLDIALGTIQAQQFENHGTFISSQSDLQVADGQNLGALKAKGLQVKTVFTNTATGAMDTPLVSGSGHLRNLGKIETEETLGLAIKRFSNSGLVKAQSVIGWIVDVSSGASLSGLEQLDNAEDGAIEATRGICFTESTQVNNFGKLQTEDMALYSDKTLQKGDLIARTLNLIGGTFLNQGEITVDHLTAENGLINQASLVTSESTDFGAGGLTNAAKAKAQLKGLGLSGDTRVINHGKLAIEGVDTALGILQITNTGSATIDAGYALPSSSALISAPGVAVDAGFELGRSGTSSRVPNFDEEFLSLSQLDAMKRASKYKRQALGIPENNKVDPEFNGLGLLDIRKAGTRYKYQALGQENHLTVDPEFRTLSKAREAGAQYKSEVLGQDPIQADPEFYTLSQAREAGTRYKAQAKLALETKLAQLQQQRSQLPPITSYDPIFKDMNGLIVKQLASRYKRQVLAIPENSQIDPEFSPMYGLVLKQVASKYKVYAENPQSYAVDQEIQKTLKELADKRWNFGLTLQERQLREAQREADRAQLAVETFKVRLSVVNQATGKLTLRSGHFDLTTDQALVNDGILSQEAAQLQWTDPTTWSQPRSFNAGTWRVKGTLTLLGNAAKDVGKLEVEDGLHVHTAEIGSRVLRGQIETTDFSVGSGIELFGSLVTHRSTQLQGLTIAADAVADLKGLKLTGGEISNLGKLMVIGVDPASGVIKLTNGGSAMIDDQQTLPKLDAHSPENLARVATHVGPTTWESGNYDYEFSNYSQITHKRAGSKYLRLCKALMAKEQYVVGHYQIEPEFTDSNGLSLKMMASRHKRAFIKLYESEVAKSQTEGSAAEQAELQQYLKQFESSYQQIFASRVAYAKSQHPAAGSALVVESDRIPAVKLQLLNQTPGQLTLKSGKFEFVGDTALVNDGILTQHSAYTLWLTKTPSAFNRGVWRAKGSFGLLGHNGNNMGDLQVEDTLHVNAICDALIALDALAKVKARRVTLQAPHLQELPETPVRASRTYPWPLEMLLSGDFGGNVDISAPALKLSSRIFQTSGNIYAHSGVFDLGAEYGVKAIHAFLGGRDGITVRSKTLEILANKVATGAAVPNILYKRPELGLYSETGPVVINVAELITCHYGDIKGTYFTITASQLINTAGLICATEPGLKSVFNVKSVKHVRDDQASYTSYSYQYGVTYNADGKNWCYCCGTRPHYCGNGCRRQIANTNYYETSGEAILFAQGDLDVTYETLEMLVSSITSLGTLKLASKVVSLDVPNLATDAELPALPGTTTMTKRNGHVNRLVAKKGLLADVGTADMAADMRGENIHIQAALVTLRSLGIAPQQQAQFIDLFTQESGSGALQMIEARGAHSGRYVDTVLPLRHKAIPDSLVVLGPDATRQMHSGAMLDVQMSMRAMEEIMGNQIYTLIRGVKGLGLSVPDFFKATSSFVRGHKDTVSQRRLIKAGEDQQEVEVQFNATLTPKDLVASGLPAVFMQFSETINTLEAERQALDAVTSKPRVMVGIPAYDVERGIIAERSVVAKSDTDLNLFTSAKAKDLVAIVAQDTLTVASDIIHHQSGENYTQTLDRTTVDSAKVLLQGHDVHLKSIDTHSTQRTDIIATGGSVVDEAVPLVSYRVDRYHSRDESTTVRTTHVHQTTSSHRSDGIAAIVAPVGILQQGIHLANARLEAPVVIQDAVHDQHMVDIETIRHKKAGGIFGSWFGITERKTTHSSSAASTARGAINAGREFIATATTRFRAVAPSFTAARSDITAPQIELTTGISHHQSFTQSTYQGPIWNKSSVSTEKHTTHCNPTFEHNVYLHSPSVILERVRGSVGTFDRVISDSPVQFRDVDDSHEHTHQSQKSLSAGAALITKLAIGLILYSNPVTFGLGGGTAGIMANAGFAALCGDAAVCLIEQDGDPTRAIRELGKRDVLKNITRSMLAAGLVHGITDLASSADVVAETATQATTSTVASEIASKSFEEYAKQAVIQSAVNTALSVAMDGQGLDAALKQGMAMAGINTLASYAAGKIGIAYFGKAFDPVTHKVLHGILGGASGATIAALFGKDVGQGAVAGALSAVVAETVVEMIKPDLPTEMSKGASKGLSEEEFKEQFIEKAQMSAKWGDFVGVLTAFGAGQDASIAHQTATNATENNFLPGILLAVTVAGTAYEGYQIYQTYKTEGGEAALKQLGITVVLTAATAGVATVGFKVGKAVYPSLQQAFRAALADRPMLASALTVMESRIGRIERYARDQFNYREHFAAERLRLAAEKKPTKFGRYAEAEDIVKAHGCSRQYIGDTHVYVVRNKETSQIYKIGESMQGVNRLGLSKRAEAQARKLFKETGQEHTTEIREIFGTKDLARSAETATIERYRSMFGKDLLPGNKGNR